MILFCRSLYVVGNFKNFIVIDLTKNNDTVYTEHTNTDLVLDSFGTSLAQTFLPRANDEIPSFPSSSVA